MLVLNRYKNKGNQDIDIIAKSPKVGDHIVIGIIDSNDIYTKVGISAPNSYKIYRRELMNDKKLDNYINSLKENYFENGGGI